MTLDGIHGRRCADHPPRFDAVKAVELAVDTSHSTGVAYCRNPWPEPTP